MRWLVRVAGAAFLALLPLSVQAQTQVGQIEGVPTGPAFWATMRFSLGPPTTDGRQRAYAEGSIDDGTAEAFQRFAATHRLPPGSIVEFHSPGGNAGEGLDLGRIIRQHAFDTTVAQPSPGASGLLARLMADRPGVCASSCSLAFLGGVSREVPKGSLYGVHDTNIEKTNADDDLLDMGQKIAGEITLYLSQMGVDPRLLSVLTQFNSHKGELFFMPADMMAQLNVTTTAKTTWSLRDTQWGFGLEGRNAPANNLPGESERVIFACTGTPRHMVLGAFYLPEAQQADAGHVMPMAPNIFVGEVSGYALNMFRGGTGPISSRFVDVPIAMQDVSSRAHVNGPHSVVAFVNLTPPAVAALRNADSLTFRFSKLGGSGSVTVDFTGGRNQAMQLIQNCR